MAFISVKSVTLRIPVVKRRGGFLQRARPLVGGNIDTLDNKRYVRALTNINVEFSAGDRVGIVGLNGSGKTSLLKVLSGIYVPTCGVVERRGVVLPFLSANFGVDTDLSARENFYLKAQLAGVADCDRDALVERAIGLSGLGEFVDYPVRGYSSGMVARVGVSSIVMECPDILIMDEWIGTGDALFKETAKQIVDEFASKAKILILASHSMALLREWTSQCLWLHKGEIRQFGDTNDVIKEYIHWVKKNNTQLNKELAQD